MSSFNLLSIGNQALQANQAALNTVGQNISNANTDGYSRQRVDLVSRPDLGGVFLNDIERIADDFLVRQVWSDSSNHNYYAKLESFANELDNLLASESTSLSTAMNEYFGALQSAVDDPTSTSARQLFVSQSDALATRINAMHDSLTRQNEGINVQIESTVAQINSIVPRIAQLNDEIEKLAASNNVPNEMLDQRDRLIEELAGYIDISTSIDQKGVVDIYIAEGQPLVLNDRAQQLRAVTGTPDATKLEIALDIGSRPNIITDRVTGGELGGLISYRESNLANAANELGRIVMAFSETMNAQHAQGMDLDGELGGLLFRDINEPDLMDARMSASVQNGGIIQQDRVEIIDVSALQASEYELLFNTNSSFTLTREVDGVMMTQGSLSGAASANDVDQDGEYFWDSSTHELTLQVDGFKIFLNGQTAFASGDTFLVQPVRSGAGDFDVALTDPRDLALASPIAGSTNIDNTGTGSLEVQVTDIDAATFGTIGAMTPEVDIVFADNAGTLQYFVYAKGVLPDPLPASPLPIPPVAGALASGDYTAGEAIEMSGSGYEFTISNSPQEGDLFSIGYNTGGVSDNRNALLMSDLQFEKVVGPSSYQDLYGSLVEKVGSETAVAQTNAQASRAVLDVSINQRESVSGVNLDEEATKLIQYQQAYTASAKLVQVSQTIFDSLLQSI